jgi:ubiquinone/menaquinone biosynthesis C-methylase UbiE
VGTPAPLPLGAAIAVGSRSQVLVRPGHCIQGLRSKWRSIREDVQMAEHQIRFEDGAAYERMMGAWSRLVGAVFLDWVAPRPGLRWVEVGCGSGAFTELLCGRCAAAQVQAIDLAEAQLAFARARPGVEAAQFRQGDATALPYPENSFDAAVMALVIFFVPEPARGVAEMARVVAPGGTVMAYAWDLPGGGVPTEPILAEMRAMSLRPPLPPSLDASRIETMRELWSGAGLDAVETHEIAVTRTFADFDDFWTTTAKSSSLVSVFAGMTSGDLDRLKERVRVRLPSDAAGRITYAGRSNAVKGRVPE